MSKLKDAEGEWVEKLPISRDLRKAMIEETNTRIWRKLRAVKVLLGIAGLEDICAGLYTFALEEYGKILLLQNYPDSDMIEIKYKKGFRDHTKKFNLIEHKLPPECLRLNPGAFDKRVFDSQAFDVNVGADFDSRLGIFYTDFVDTGDAIKRIPKVNRMTLENAVESFERYMEKKMSELGWHP